MHQLGVRQDGIRGHDLLAIDPAEGSREQTELLNEHGVVVDHNQVSDVEHMSGENENKLEC